MHELRMSWGRMAYARAGTGRPVIVFLHGTGCDSADWAGVARHLPSSLQRVCLDFRGHGASAVPADAFTIADLATDVATLLDALQPAQAILVGHSLGGMVAMAVASQTRRVSGLVLLEGWTHLRAAQAFAGDRFYGHLPPHAVRHIREKSERTSKAFHPAVWQALWKSVEAFDGGPYLQAAEVPVFEVYGGMGRTAATEPLLMIPPNPAITTLWIAEAGHYLPHEKPLEVARICTQMIHRSEQHEAVQRDLSHR
jgi:pimeloyl-ACP methyl ester carboxylesterase